MNCAEAQRLLNPYTDGELDLVCQLEMAEHLGTCPTCAQQERNLFSLRAAISSPAAPASPTSPTLPMAAPSLYYRAPESLRNRLELGASPLVPPVRRKTRLLAVAAGFLLFFIATVAIGTLFLQRHISAEDRLAESVVAGHVRSLQVEHLTDVASNDRHTVKPWFQFKAKLDFSPEVRNLDEEFKLSGGRLDYLAGRPVAALVYMRRSHAINLFTWPADNEKERTVMAMTRQGYHIRHWQHAGMIYWAISDLNDQELDDFVRLMQVGQAEGSR